MIIEQSQHIIDEVSKVFIGKDEIIKKFGELLSKQSFSQDLKAGDVNSVCRRIDAIDRLVKELL